MKQADKSGGIIRRERWPLANQKGHMHYQRASHSFPAAGLQQISMIASKQLRLQPQPYSTLPSSAFLGKCETGRLSQGQAVGLLSSIGRRLAQSFAHRKTSGIRAGLRAGPSEDGCDSQTPSKQCLECGRLKLPVDFKSTKTSADGLMDSCRACLAVCSAKRIGRELGHLGVSINEAWERAKTCTHCRCMKEVRDFALDRATKDGLSCWCRGCVAAAKAARPKWEPQDGPQQCRRCKEVKSAGDFNVDKNERSGLTVFCKACASQLAKGLHSRRRRFAGQAVAPRVAKRCSICTKMKKAGEFNSSVGSSDGLTAMCKACKSAQELARYRAKRRKPEELLNDAEASPQASELDS